MLHLCVCVCVLFNVSLGALCGESGLKAQYDFQGSPWDLTLALVWTTEHSASSYQLSVDRAARPSCPCCPCGLR